MQLSVMVTAKAFPLKLACVAAFSGVHMYSKGADADELVQKTAIDRSVVSDFID